MMPEKAQKRWPAFKEPEWLKVWVEGHHNPSEAVYWKDEVFVLKAGTSDTVEWLIEREASGQDVLYVGSENAGLRYRGVERFIPGEGDQLAARVYSVPRHLQGRLPIDEETMVREAVDQRFYDSDLEEVEDMTLKEFIDYVM